MTLLEAKGWTNHFTCNNCTGKGPLQHWINKSFPDYEIRIRTRRNTFSIYNKNMKVFGPDWFYKLEEGLKKFNIYEVPVV
jgi:hypothetical protein